MTDKMNEKTADVGPSALSDVLGGACENTDTEIWRKKSGDFYSPRMFATKNGSIGIDVAGHVIVMPVEKWHALGRLQFSLEDVLCPPNAQTKPRADTAREEEET